MGQPFSKCTIRIMAAALLHGPLLRILASRSFLSIPLLLCRMQDYPRALAIFSQLCQHKMPLVHIPTVTCCRTLLISLGTHLIFYLIHLKQYYTGDLDFDLHTSRRPSNHSCSRISYIIHTWCIAHPCILKIYTRTQLLISLLIQHQHQSV